MDYLDRSNLTPAYVSGIKNGSGWVGDVSLMLSICALTLRLDMLCEVSICFILES